MQRMTHVLLAGRAVFPKYRWPSRTRRVVSQLRKILAWGRPPSAVHRVKLDSPFLYGQTNLDTTTRQGSGAVSSLNRGRHPEHSRFSGGAKDLPLDRLGV